MGRPRKRERVEPAIELDLEKIQARALKAKMLRLGGFEHFVRHFWEVVDPAPLVWNWHMDALCLMLEMLGRGVIRKLLINMPPGMGKSILCGVLWPAWKWALEPSWSCIFVSHDESLVLRDSVKARDLIKHPEFKRIFRPEWDLEAWDFNTSQDTKHLYKNTCGGMRYSTSIGAAITGFRGSAVVIDDPLDATKAVSEIEIKNANDYISILPTRLNNLMQSQWLLVMQRVCEGDPSDEQLKKGGWTWLNLPAEYDPENPCVIEVDGEEVWRDPRTERGEPMFPQIQAEDALGELRLEMDDPKFEAQYNQRIIAHKGGIVKWEDLRWYDHNPLTVMRERMTEVILSVDLTFMKTEAKQREVEERRAFNNLDVWGTDGRGFHLLDTARGRWQYPEFEAVFCEIVERWRIWTVVMEMAAVAPVVKSLLAHKVGQIIDIEPRGSKESRLQAAARYARQRRVYLPLTDWGREWATEVTRFGISAFKDRADTFSMALLYFTLESGVDLGGASPQSSNPYAADIQIEMHNPAGYML